MFLLPRGAGAVLFLIERLRYTGLLAQATAGGARRTMRFQLALTGLLTTAMALCGSAALAQAPRALVIGNGAYGFLPPLPECAASAKIVASALRGAGFEVAEKTDLSSGAMQAALGGFAKAASGGPALLYVCGYASAYNDRDFMLPISASLARPSDVLAQGVLAKSVADSLTGSPGLVVLDAAPLVSGGTAPLAFEILKTMSLPDGVGLAAVTEAKSGDGPTPLANALAGGIGPRLDPASALTALQRAVPSSGGVRFAVVRPPRPIAARPAPLAVVPAPVPAPIPAPVPAPLPAPVAPAASAAPSAPAMSLDESSMSDAERRRVQIGLAQLGYYDGRIDGVFGPETRAAIRRYQHELKADMTGTLLPDQTARLLK